MKNKEENFLAVAPRQTPETKVATELKKSRKKNFFKKLIFWAFFLESIYLFLLLLSDIYLGFISGEDRNIVTEVLGILFLWVMNFWLYYNFYKAGQKKQKTKKEIEIENQEKTYRAIQKKLFQEALMNFKKPDFESKILGMDQMVRAVAGLPEKRKITLDYLSSVNQWMLEKAGFLTNQNLIVWRFQNRFFIEISEEAQKLSMHAISCAEKIIKQHLEVFQESAKVDLLDISALIFPTLTLTKAQVPKGALIFVGSKLWEANFAESKFDMTNFSEAKLQKSNFTKSTLKNVNFTGANLKGAHLKTLLYRLKNFSAEQFFSSYKWEEALLSETQEKEFFASCGTKTEETLDRWSLRAPNRKMLLDSTPNILESLNENTQENHLVN